jgi:two-component system sensor histidine kinase SenX3
LESHPTGIVIAGPSGSIEYRNRAAHQLAGTHSGVLIDEAIEKHLAAALAGVAADETIELYGPPKRVFEVVAKRLPNGGSVAFVNDISERRRVDQVRTDFVANISHELKTPIGALAVLAETLIDETDPATIRRVADRMLAESDRAARTIDDLMELSRIESGADQHMEVVRVADIIRGALDRVTELAQQRDITINALDTVDETGVRSQQLFVRGDRRELVSALGNLVENAVKYSEPGSAVQVRARHEPGWIDVAVVDRGVGIPQRDLDRVFERFYRVDRARSRTTGGTGLGLSIVRHVASNHGGSVLVTSTEGEGSTFVLRLPDEGHRAQQPIQSYREEGAA